MQMERGKTPHVKGMQCTNKKIKKFPRSSGKKCELVARRLNCDILLDFDWYSKLDFAGCSA